VYACVCKGKEIQSDGGCHKEALKNTLSAFIEGTVSGSQSDKPKGSFNHGPYSYNFIKDRGFTFIAIARKEVEIRIVFSFLKEMQNHFNAGTDKTGFKRVINDLIATYQNPEEVDKVQRINEDLEYVKGIMRQNLENMVKRGDQLEKLDESVVQLEQDAGIFKKQAQEVKKVVWWRDLRCKIVTGIILLIIIFVIIVVACGGFEFQNCKSKT